MQWMVDFDAAEAAGMALRIPIPAALLAAGLDSLVVFGSAAATSAADTAAQLAQLLDAHHYTDGLEFLPLGTPTNNTADRRAGYSSDDPGHARSFATEVGADPRSFDASSNALRLGAALGLPADRIAAGLGHVEQAGAIARARPAQHEHRAVAVRLGLLPQQHDRLRRHRADAGSRRAGRASISSTHVRSAGPFPPLRCGQQPYGVLPVTSLDLWQPRAGEARSRATPGCSSCCSTCATKSGARASADVPRVGARHDPPDPDADLADVMRTDAHLEQLRRARACSAATTSSICAPSSAQNSRRNGFIAAQDAIASKLLAQARHPVAAAPRRAAYADVTWRVDLAARPGRRSLAVADARAELHRRAARAADDRRVIAARPDPAATDARPACCRRCCAMRCCARSRPPRRRSRRARRATISRRCCATPSWSIS